MKRYFMICIAIILCLTAFGCKNVAPEVEDSGLLEYPGTHWGDAPETVMESLGLSKDGVEQKESDGGCYIGLPGGTYFDVPSAGMVFRFEVDNNGVYGLTRVEIYYPEEADLAPACAALEKLYGPKAESMTTLDRTLNDDGTTLYAMKTDALSEEVLGFWASEPLSSNFNQADRDAVRKFFCESAEDPMPEEIFQEYWEKEPLVTLQCTNDAYPQFIELPEAAHRKAVIFSATEMHYIQMICDGFGK